jgi:hypothetical protein
MQRDGRGQQEGIIMNGMGIWGWGCKSFVIRIRRCCFSFELKVNLTQIMNEKSGKKEMVYICTSIHWINQ